MKKQNIFLMGGRTGGPLLPVIAISKELPEFTPIIIGVKGGFEEKYSISQSIEFHSLPEAKLTLASFSNLSFMETIGELFAAFWMIVKLSWSILKSIYYLVKFKPKAILTSGSFLGVPMVIACKFTNLLRLTNTKTIIHQQDAKPSLSNKLVARFADKITAYFPETSKLLGPKCTVTANPINFDKFSDLSIRNELINADLRRFVESKSSLPLLLIFGGGSGAFAINKWVFENIKLLSAQFRVLHLTGALQENSVFKIANSPSYHSLPFLTSQMPYAIKKADLVICRAGMASISELVYNKKKAFLIPIPYSHQEDNAFFVKEFFPTLKQRYTVSKPGKEDWLRMIQEFYPQFFDSVTYPSNDEIITNFRKYILEVRELLSR